MLQSIFDQISFPKVNFCGRVHHSSINLNLSDKFVVGLCPFYNFISFSSAQKNFAGTFLKLASRCVTTTGAFAPKPCGIFVP